MSTKGTKRLGDLKELPPCAPPGLKALFTLAEGVIQTQIDKLGSGKPSEAPDLHKLLRDKGIAQPEDQSIMIERYTEHQKGVEKVISGIHRKDDGIVKRTAGIGKAVTNAYDAIDTSVGELNEKITASYGALQPVIDPKTCRPVKDEQGHIKKMMPKDIVDGLFEGVWDTLNTTYTQVSSVSDRVAAEAIKIREDEPKFTPTHNNNGGGIQPVSYSPSEYSGNTPWTPVSDTTGTAIIPTGDIPTAKAMMEYLIKEHHFTPAQAAGIVANAKFESGFKVGATGDGETARGLFQWRFDRQDNLLAYAKKPGESLGDWRTHVDYMVDELNHSKDPKIMQGRQLVYATKDDPRAVAEYFDRYYEKSSGSTIEKRRSYAAGLLEEWNQSQTALAV
ncbi:phage tail tip lysozyme [Nocardia brevicatena]|uniref:phage tail tip lysozyme n=1 Tax=Nocardia brevicatena TaxID=37327 RepID=UPI000312E4E0|nr:phage tail tip lysozyme [Nocardia brevicatena]